ncbi:MAG: universal stress protein, partial [Bdellovibrionota bacterium]
MNQQTPVKKIIWAVDPFAEESKLQRPAAWAIRRIVEHSQATVTPVYLFGGFPMKVPMRTPPELVAQVRSRAQSRLNELVGRLPIAGLQPLEIVSDPFFTIRQGVDALIGFSRDRGADLIALSTHSRKGLGRFVMGSFAETVVLRSEIPLLVVNPHQRASVDFKKILFLTDFSSESRQAFDRVLLLANSLESEVTVFHKLQFLQTPALRSGILSNSVYRKAFDEELSQRKAEAQRWVELASERGVRAKAKVESRKAVSAADSALEFLAKHPALVALASRSGPMSSTLLGSTARKLVRSSQI